MPDLDQQLKNLDPKQFPNLVRKYAVNPEWLKEQLQGFQKKQLDAPLESLLADLESDLQHLPGGQSPSDQF